MKIELIGSESLGTRSMATYIETKDLKIFVDPGVSLAPMRYGLPPHPIEIEEKNNTWKTIVEYASKSDIIIITHYHFDHFNIRECLEEIYDGKLLFMKDPENNINHSQFRRSHLLLHKFRELDIKPAINIADKNYLEIGDTKILFSPPIPHGHDTRLGFVIMVYIEDNRDKFIHTSDVEGPYSEDAVDFILNNSPSKIYIDGPMTYMAGRSISYEVIDKTLKNLVKIALNNENDVIILDHHFMRDLEYKYWIKKLVDEVGRSGINLNILSAAEYMGKKLKMLEAMRKTLYEFYPDTL